MLSLHIKLLKMKKTLFTLLLCLAASFCFADSVLFEGFEYANHDLTTPIGWNCDDNSWLCGYLDKDHNRTPHNGNWYAFTDADDSWMFMNLFFSHELKYRFYYWAISDGEYDVEIWAGNGPSSSEMTQLLFSRTVNSDEYQLFSEYVETIPTDYQYFGIHATAHTGAYHLTIDDITIDMVNRYDIEVDPYEIRTTMNAGEQITIEYDVQNTGYEDLHIYMTPYTDFFTNISFTEDGLNYSSFPTVPNQIVHCTCTATLLPNLEPGTLCWMDIMFTVSCDCITRMSTLWVTVNDPTAAVDEQENEAEVLQVEVFDLTGKKVDPANLKAGIYVERTTTSNGVSSKKILKQ